MNHPLISIALPTKNSLPHLKKAIDGIRRQTCKNFELIIQDGGSTDGTLEYLEGIKDIPNMKIESKPDSGIGEAYGRAMARGRGEYFCFTASDEFLFDYSLEMGLSWYKKNPEAIVFHGAMMFVDQKGKNIGSFIPREFDLEKVITCECVPPMIGLFNRKIIDGEFYFDQTLKSCPDYEFWLRVGSRFSKDRFFCQPKFFSMGLRDRTSMSFRSESFDQFCKDKCFCLNRFLDEYPSGAKYKKLRNEAQARIFSWAISQVLSIEGVSDTAIKLAQKGQEFYEKTIPSLENFQHFDTKIFREHLHLFKTSILQKIKALFSKKGKSYPIKIAGNRKDWSYIYRWCFKNLAPTLYSPFWVKIRMEVSSGAIGVCLMEKDTIKKERVYLAENKPVTLLFSLENSSKPSLIIRNGGIPSSSATIYEVSVLEYCKFTPKA